MDNVISINRPFIDKLKAALEQIKKIKGLPKEYNAIFIDSKGFFRVETVTEGTQSYSFAEIPAVRIMTKEPDWSAVPDAKKVDFYFYELFEGLAVFRQADL